MIFFEFAPQAWKLAQIHETMILILNFCMKSLFGDFNSIKNSFY
ncbi:hypothetical protein LEP1GSC008_1960 [Leptospira kirschneri serovar Bulgarica str. Nikolaevo]|uniref:Uncharacterized protein n=1 Tax=Leptospira kirschneri serovar Bulgarica str. Nikolaevo TaxID=1240687 RepID=M6F7K3_9LEPT|nr:hypothetical protein LEP1GSC008_1960 [Leptospira kirschneri serovar Bulgarica str. Nikolaevo]